jgi:CubicO group peptidase (beta-lactamase class C family)
VNSIKSIWLVSAALAVACSPLPQDSGPSRARNDDLIGIWTFETEFETGLNGDLIVAREGSAWRATLSGAEAKFEVAARDVRFAFPGDLGRFRGALADDARLIEGFWIRPGVAADPRFPGGSSQPFATPLLLKSVGRDVWRGEVRPLEDSMTLYLRIFRDEEETLLAAFRNPDQHSHGGAMQFRVAREGRTVQFTAPLDHAEPEIRHEGTLVRSEALQIFWPDLDRTIMLTRRAPSEAAAYFPRPPDDPPYVYRSPPVTNDGWATARAGEVGIDEEALERLVRRLAAADPSGRRPSLIHSLLVARRGKLVLEEYFYGFHRDQPHDLRSAGKTFASVMLGAAMMQGVQVAPETRAYELLAGMGPFKNDDPRKSKITLADLMTHTSGLACDDYDDASPGNEDTLQTQRAQPDWWRYTLDLPIAHEPGTRYAYCSATMNLVGAALTTATGTWLPELFDRTVARPLQFGPYHWNLSPTDEGYLGGGAWLQPRDLLKLGQVYLDGGAWRGRRIVDTFWVTQSTAPHFHISPATTGIDAEQFGNAYSEADEAYAWHLGGVRSGEHVYPGYAATGNGGQVLMVVPGLELAVVFTGGNYRQGGIWTRWADEIVGGEIIPALDR